SKYIYLSKFLIKSFILFILKKNSILRLYIDYYSFNKNTLKKREFYILLYEIEKLIKIYIIVISYKVNIITTNITNIKYFKKFVKYYNIIYINHNFVYVYIDDIVIFSKNIDKYYRYVKIVLRIFNEISSLLQT
ncbi:hypothetical protein CONLIGDRAFT_587588, partial [Coniochaeta ligniaria NRRL 30616]